MEVQLTSGHTCSNKKHGQTPRPRKNNRGLTNKNLNLFLSYLGSGRDLDTQNWKEKWEKKTPNKLDKPKGKIPSGVANYMVVKYHIEDEYLLISWHPHCEWPNIKTRENKSLSYFTLDPMQASQRKYFQGEIITHLFLMLIICWSCFDVDFHSSYFEIHPLITYAHTKHEPFLFS